MRWEWHPSATSPPRDMQGKTESVLRSGDEEVPMHPENVTQRTAVANSV